MRCQLLLSVGLGLALASAAVIDARAASRSSDADDIYRLPEGLLFGAGTSAYQVEGAWDEDGKGVNVFDYYYHTNNVTEDKNGDVAADSYHRYKEDIALGAELGLTTIRISLSWSRIFPDGDTTQAPNAKGVQHYHDVLAEMMKYNITPLVTIHHFDYPQALEDKFGGWLGSEMADEFAKFADFVFGEYTEVKYWLTINEAYMYCNLAANANQVPPGTMKTSEQKYTCLHNLIRGHAKAYKVYEKKYKQLGGMIGFGVGPNFYRPSTDSAEDIAAADNKNLINGGIGCSLEPFFTGDYPEVCKNSERKNFTAEEKEMLLGSIDFAGVNIYNGANVSASASAEAGGVGPSGDGGSEGGRPDGKGPEEGGAPGGGRGRPDELGSVSTSSAWVLRSIPTWVNKRYNNLPVFFTETGTTSGTVIDDWEIRAVFASAYLRELVAGINVDKNNVIGCSMWSLTDTFEFGSYTAGWGMIHVDFQGKTLTRTLKTSAKFFQEMMSTGVVPLVTASA